MIIEAMIDRFSDNNQAVILAEKTGKEFVVHQSKLPEGAKPGDYLQLKVSKEVLTEITFDKMKTEERKRQVSSAFERLKQRESKSMFRK
ncbi:hypothetical protein DES38_102320 [Streptohalobacillus salinus]|uniref:DUF3006 family protein n=1 Tax=Streptohalobacillus salinus TaxID=621096 RepID=A0A2V3WD91_9BACI|nr:DUF3006 domain-containing protein [Streptohalobacillus salinus]PXW92736.1 hypothetical protein DES38_102320 [Streptohalobacillus salinus]